MAASPGNSTLLANNLSKELGVSGTIDYGGFIRSEEYNRNLQGRKGWEIYDTMGRSDGTVHAGLQVCKLPLEAAKWKFKSPTTDSINQEQTDFLNREFNDRNIDFTAVLSEGLTCLDFGYSVGEIVYDKTTFNGQFRWGLEKLASRKQLSIMKWQTSTGIPGVTQLTYGTDQNKPASVDIPMQKLFVFTNEKRGDNYEGISMLRFAYKHWFLKDKLELMNAVALERMGLGIPYVKTGINGADTPPDVIAEVENALRQIRVNQEAYLKYPASLEIGMLPFDASKAKDILPTIQYEDTQILLSVLAQFLGLGLNGKGGSRALSGDQSQLFIRSLEALSQTMIRGFQSIANRLIDLNYSPNTLVNGYPKFEVEDLDDDDVTSLSTAIQLLVQSGAITPGMAVENRSRRLVDIEEVTQEDWDKLQADKQAAIQQKADQAKQLADAQAKQQPALPPPTEKEPEVPKPKPVADKAKPSKKKDGLTSSTDALDLLDINASDYPGLFESLGIDQDNLGCIMLDLQPFEVSKYVQGASADLYADPNEAANTGKATAETEAHVTLLFGLLQNGNAIKDQVDKLLDGWHCDSVVIGCVDSFPVPADAPSVPIVAKLNAWDGNLIDGHDRLTLLPHVNTFSTYTPHVTLAYVKNDPAIVRKWVKSLNEELTGMRVTSTGINYGNPDKGPAVADKSKLKADKLTAADRAVDELFAALADELVGV